MKGNRVFMPCLLVFVLVCCRTSSKPKMILTTNERNQQPIEGETIKYIPPVIPKDSTFVFLCGGEEVTVDFQNMNQPYFPNWLRKCLAEQGFIGDSQANRSLADMILSLGLAGFMNAMSYANYDYRGPQVFEAGLKVAEDFTLVGNPNTGYITGTKSASVHSFLYNMIESMDGDSNRRNWVCKVYEYNDMSCIRTIKPGMIDMEYHVLRHDTIKKMWQEGKIKLKPFGAE